MTTPIEDQDQAAADTLALVDSIINGPAVLDEEGNPVPALVGTFALYGDQGSLVAVLLVKPSAQLPQAEGEHTIRLPGAVIKMGRTMASGSGVVGRLLGRLSRA